MPSPPSATAEPPKLSSPLPVGTWTPAAPKTDVLPPVAPLPGEPARTPLASSRLPPWIARIAWWVSSQFLFDGCSADPELGRHARLIGWFGFVGTLFGSLYAAFYLAIGHLWGAGIVAGCSLGFFIAPFVMRARASIWVGGNFLIAVMTLGFTALCCVEGGLKGHAVAWLSSVPLCALLLMGRRWASLWVVISLGAASAIVTADLIGFELPIKYQYAWHPLVNAAGYLGLIAFLFALGLIFELGREHAFGKMTGALHDLAQSNEKLSSLNREKSEFLGIAAHDLRNPLTIIINYADLLRDEQRAAKVPKFANAIYEAGSRMRTLISNLLDSHAAEEGRFSSQLERCEIAQLVTVSVAQNQPHATSKGTELIVSLTDDLHARVDRSTSVQVLDNLISNAVKYSPPNSRVFISGNEDKGDVVIAVKDQGPGIGPEDRARLFGRFARLTARPTGGESSTGLGLSIVKKLVEAMHGTIECQSQLGQGATFVVRLPAIKADSLG